MTADHHLRPESDEAATPITPVSVAALDTWLERQSPDLRRWATETGFVAEPGSTCMVPGEGGDLARVLLGVGSDPTPWDWAGLPVQLPGRTYRVDADLERAAADAAALGWGLGAYRFDRYRKAAGSLADLVYPDRCDRSGVERAVSATYRVRDLVNTPAADMGPAELAAAAEDLVALHGGRSSVIVGDELLAANYPAVHAVGRTSNRAPRLIDLEWGDAAAPRVTLVGKGVCFDSGGGSTR